MTPDERIMEVLTAQDDTASTVKAVAERTGLSEQVVAERLHQLWRKGDVSRWLQFEPNGCTWELWQYHVSPYKGRHDAEADSFLHAIEAAYRIGIEAGWDRYKYPPRLPVGIG